MKAKKSKSKQSKKAVQAQASASRLMFTGLLLLSALLAGLFIKSVIRMSHQSPVEQLGFPGPIPALSAFSIAVYVWFASPYPVHRYRYGSLVVLSVLLTGYIIWLLGMASASLFI
ncbi:hypothetical protein BH23PAT1_BH23PAT1_0540 [soil metagenome]